MALGALVAASLLAGPLLAAPMFATSADAVKSRVAQLRELGSAFKNVRDQLNSGTPELFIIQESARQIRDASRDQYTWFPAGSGPQPGLKTHAKPDIWERPADFKAAQDAFATEANAFFDAASGGDIDKIRAAQDPLGHACASCHKTFREKMEP